MEVTPPLALSDAHTVFIDSAWHHACCPQEPNIRECDAMAFLNAQMMVEQLIQGHVPVNIGADGIGRLRYTVRGAGAAQPAAQAQAAAPAPAVHRCVLALLHSLDLDGGCLCAQRIVMQSCLVPHLSVP
jgi:hypothetical protein